MKAKKSYKVMKANAPEKLYVDTEDRLSDSILYGFTQKHKDDDIEYVRTDAFIEKALKYLDENFYFKNSCYRIECGVFDSKEEMLKDFKKYMED
jgi:hypothetical protein